MIPEFEGAYSWSRYTKLLNPAWMREWPESFLTERVLASGQLPSKAVARMPAAGVAEVRGEAMAYFAGMRMKIKSTVSGLAEKLAGVLHDESQDSTSNVIAEVEIGLQWGMYFLKVGGNTVAEVSSEREVPRALLKYLVPVLWSARKNHSWFDGMVVRQADTVVLIVGDWQASSGASALARPLSEHGWELFGDEMIPVRQDDCMVLPFARCGGTGGKITERNREACKLDAVVYGSRQLHNKGSIFSLSPSAAVAELTRSSADFTLDREACMKRLCDLVEQVPVYQLNYNREQEVSKMLTQLTEHHKSDLQNRAQG